jgi:predicted N-acyltransferase
MPTPIQKLNLALSWHKERHRPTGFGFTIADSIDFIDPKTWDDLTSTQSFFLTRAYLRALEQNAPTNMRLPMGTKWDNRY